MKWQPARILEPELAAALVEAWGYPRAIDPSEIEGADWFRLGSRVIWWYEAEDARMPGSRFLHLAVAPAARRRWPVRYWLDIAYGLAAEMGAEQIVVADLGGAGHVADYLRRLGWTEAGPFMVKPVGGESVGDSIMGIFLNSLGNKPKPPVQVDQSQVAQDAAAREKERQRIASGNAGTYSSRKVDALSASIGKRFLGGVS